MHLDSFLATTNKDEGIILLSQSPLEIRGIDMPRAVALISISDYMYMYQ